MHILFDLRSLSHVYKAVEVYLTALVDSLVPAIQENDTVTIFCEKGVSLPYSRILHPSIIYREARHDGYSFRGKCELRALVRVKHVDVYFSADPLLPKPSFGHQVRTIYAIEEMLHFTHRRQFPFFERWRWRTLAKPQLRSADIILCPSRTIRKRFSAFMGLSIRKQVLVIGNGVHPSFRPHSEAEIRAVRQHFLIPKKYTLSVYCQYDNESLETIFRALSENEEVSAMPCYMIGLEKLTPEVRSRIRAYHLEGLIRPLPASIDIPALSTIFSGAQVTFQPVTTLAYHPAILQSMACGTPVICVANKHTEEMVGSAAMRVHPTDADEWRKAFTALTVSAPLRERMIQRGFDCARHFSWTQTTKQTLTQARRLSHDA